MYFIFLGPPGSGKGSQAQKLAKHFNIAYISTGDLLRKSNDPDIQRRIQCGEIVPTEKIILLFKEKFLQHPQRGWVLDGFPRTIEQALFLKKMITYSFITIYLNVSLKEIMQRLSMRKICQHCNAIYNLLYNPPKSSGLCDSCQHPLIQRSDDSESVIQHRLQIYQETTAPLIEWLKKEGPFIEIKSENHSIDHIYQQILHEIAPLLKHPNKKSNSSLKN